MSDNIFISIVICTHRRPDSLALTLDSLCKEAESYKENDFEVVIVENDTTPSESVAEVIQQYKIRLPLRWCIENIPNLSRARNLGAQEAKGEYLAYCDDDIEYVGGWLLNLSKNLKEYSPDICGGPSYPLYRVRKPYWYLDKWATSYYEGEKIINTNENFGGMNFIVRKDLVISIGGFDESFGMTGDKIAYGEETELMKRAREYNVSLKTIYFPDVAVRHEVRPIKMTLLWNIQSTWAAGRDFVRIVEKTGSLKGLLYALMKAIFMFVIYTPIVVLFFITDAFHPKTSVWKRYFVLLLIPNILRIFIHIQRLKLVINKTSK